MIRFVAMVSVAIAIAGCSAHAAKVGLGASAIIAFSLAIPHAVRRRRDHGVRRGWCDRPARSRRHDWIGGGSVRRAVLAMAVVAQLGCSRPVALFGASVGAVSTVSGLACMDCNDRNPVLPSTGAMLVGIGVTAMALSLIGYMIEVETR